MALAIFFVRLARFCHSLVGMLVNQRYGFLGIKRVCPFWLGLMVKKAR